MELTATAQILQEISTRFSQPFSVLNLRIFPPHGPICRGRLKIVTGIVSLYLEVIKTTGTTIWTLDKEKCTRWNSVLKYNTAMVYDGFRHVPISKETKGTVHLSNITEGFLEFDANTIDNFITLVCAYLEQLQPAANWTKGIDTSMFQGGKS